MNANLTSIIGQYNFAISTSSARFPGTDHIAWGMDIGVAGVNDPVLDEGADYQDFIGWFSNSPSPSEI
ncbi:MAG TPA: hypothetical protein VFW11_23630 [Cyclobacteriaceae bacterium]|nr:hypothetical protein [Cyclobacteriaceae bacterium]